MNWFPDMGSVTMIDAGDHIRAVGWLSAEHSFTKGGVPTAFLERLWQFAKNWRQSTTALGWGCYMGSHGCALCEMGPPPWRRFRAAGNLGVPSAGLLFVAPEMIAHYVEVHRYRPPDEFIAAVMASPLPGTEEYRIVVEPFRLLHEQHRERQVQVQIEQAARWAVASGGSEEAISEAGVRFLGTGSLGDKIRRAMVGICEGTGENRN